MSTLTRTNGGQLMLRLAHLLVAFFHAAAAIIITLKWLRMPWKTKGMPGTLTLVRK
jgi:hypothetical protein